MHGRVLLTGAMNKRVQLNKDTSQNKDTSVHEASRTHLQAQQNLLVRCLCVHPPDQLHAQCEVLVRANILEAVADAHWALPALRSSFPPRTDDAECAIPFAVPLLLDPLLSQPA